jgi:histidinol phosphatase-like enzyme
MHANARQKTKQFIAKIQDGDATVTSQADKLEKVHDYFRRILGSTENREGTLNWESLGYT